MVALIALSVVALGAVLASTGLLDRADPSARSRPSGASGRPAGSVGDGDQVGRAPPAPAELRQLKIVTHPEGATLGLAGADGDAWKGITPFKDRLPEGTLDLTLTLKGYNRLTHQVVLDRRRALDLWLDPKGLLHHKLGTWESGPAPKQVAFSPDGTELWISDLGGHGVEVFDARSMELLDTIKLGEHGAVEVIFTRDGQSVFASQMETASVFEIDRATRKVRRQMFTTGSWSKVMALSPDEKTLFVSNWVSDDVSEIDLATGQERRRIATVDTPRGLYVSPDGRKLFVAGYETGELQRINLVTGNSKVLLATGGAIRHLVGDPERKLLFASDMATDEVYVVDLATEGVHKLADTDNTPNTIDLSPDGRVLYVSNRGQNNSVSYYIPGPEWGSVLVIDTASGRCLDAIVGGNQTTGLDLSPDGTTLAFSDFLDNTVTLYAVPPYDVLASGNGGRCRSHLPDLAK